MFFYSEGIVVAFLCHHKNTSSKSGRVSASGSSGGKLSTRAKALLERSQLKPFSARRPARVLKSDQQAPIIEKGRKDNHVQIFTDSGKSSIRGGAVERNLLFRVFRVAQFFVFFSPQKRLCSWTCEVVSTLFHLLANTVEEYGIVRMRTVLSGM